MTTSEPDLPANIDPEVEQIVTSQIKDERKRRMLLIALVALLSGTCCVGIILYRYLTKPEPLPELLPDVVSENIYYPPTYMFAINGVDRPNGVAVSPDGQRIYVAEGGGERLIKMFDRDGNLIQSFAPPGTNASNRKLMYLAVDPTGRVYVSEIYNHVIDIFDADGNFLDAIIGQDMTLSKFVAGFNEGNIPAGTLFYFDILDQSVHYQLPNEEKLSHPFTLDGSWNPLGIRFDDSGNLMLTNIVSGLHQVMIVPAAAINGPLKDYNPQISVFGQEGKGDGQFSFPNSVITDSRGSYYVSDGNNGRISQWTSTMQYKTFFGFGTADSGLNLPRGIWMDNRDFLHVADAVGEQIRVYDVSGDEDKWLYNFGDFGDAAGLFNHPTDVTMDSSKRVYVADKENNRISVWSY